MKKIIIAEIGSVHDGSFGNAINLIESASKCGADYVKFQTHIAEAESLKGAPSPSYFKDETRIDYFKRTAFSISAWKKLMKKAEECGVGFISSPFSLEAVDLLEEVGVSMYKIPSGEVSNTPLIEKIAKLGKPVIISSGMSDWTDLDVAINLLKDNCELNVMQCSSAYPCPNEQVGLNVIKEIKSRYNCSVGFSDHSLGFAAAVSAAALGAMVVEKHFTFSKEMYGSDAKHAMEPREFKVFCDSVKDVWEMLDNPVDKSDVSNYREMKLVFEKSIVAKHALSAGTVLEFEHMSFKKPGTGIEAKKYLDIIGKKLIVNVDKDEMLKMDYLK